CIKEADMALSLREYVIHCGGIQMPVIGAILFGDLKDNNTLLCQNWWVVLIICAIVFTGMLVLLADECITQFNKAAQMNGPFRENFKLYLIHLKQLWKEIILISLYIVFSAVILNASYSLRGLCKP
ncbi:hypothetical protein KI387_040875, partial [Taxus chinensis]